MQFAGFAEGPRRLFIGLLTGWGAVLGAQAQGPSQTLGPSHSPAAPTQPGSLPTVADAALSPEQQAVQWYARGLAAQQAGRLPEASEAFTRVLALDPAFAGAWLDLAVVTFQRGDVAQSEEFLGILERRFAPLPDAVSLGIAALRERIAAGQVPPGWRWRHAIQAGTGRDSNANSGLSLQNITLTLPGGAILLPLDAGFKPRADSYALTQFSSEGQRRVGQGELEVATSLRARRNRAEHAFDTTELQAGVAYAGGQPLAGGALPFLAGPWRIGAQAQVARLGEATALQVLSLHGLHAWSQAACSPQASLQLDWRRFPTARPLDSRIGWLGAQWNCPSPLPGPAQRLKLQVRLGHETARIPDTEAQGRPGGNTRHQESTLTQDWQWAGPWGMHRIEAVAQWAEASDTKGYSPVLDDDARRVLRRSTAALAYLMPLPAPGTEAGRWTAIWSAQAYRQRSNLGIFRMRGEVLQVSLQRA